jgi:hypothetical protein
VSSSASSSTSPADASAPTRAPVDDGGIADTEPDYSGGDRPGDPCKYPGPELGSACTPQGVVCLSEDWNGLGETRCLQGQWGHRRAKPWRRARHRACPPSPPISGSPCTGAGECAYTTCMISDDAGLPIIFNPFYPNWVCYEGSWRRYDTRCLGE